MKIDVLIGEIGSTTTIVNAFDGLDGEVPVFLGFGMADTTAGDLRLGLNSAILDLKRRLGWEVLEYGGLLATSSAAGGLGMTAHGLAYEMTAKAAKEAALGAGAIVKMTTAGRLTQEDLLEMSAINPNLILLAGGTDYGDKQNALYNAQALCASDIEAPVIYCGNIQNQSAIRNIFKQAGRKLYITENVYPQLDKLNIEPVRKIIHQAFEEHITGGMENGELKIENENRKTLDNSGFSILNSQFKRILPTPGGVMECAGLLYELIGDLLVVDIGGATTDIHSVTAGSEEISQIQANPEPFAKRTVEGDLGLFVNAQHLAEMIGFDQLEQELGMEIKPIFDNYQPIPTTSEQLALTERLAFHAAKIAISRHAGVLHHSYGPSGRKTHAIGKDLTAVRHIVFTGGITRLQGRKAIMREICGINNSGKMLFPKQEQLKILEDTNYIMASLGVLAKTEPKMSSLLLQKYILGMELKA